jgi:hypothetical protein
MPGGLLAELARSVWCAVFQYTRGRIATDSGEILNRDRDLAQVQSGGNRQSDRAKDFDQMQIVTDARDFAGTCRLL